jgi:adenylate cyclase
MGDAYMVAGGLPDPMPDHAAAVAELAWRCWTSPPAKASPMAAGSAAHRDRLGAGGGRGHRQAEVQLRPVGDTVNTASRMQTTGIPGCIQVTERTRQLLGERYLFRERGIIQVKGKGKMRTYFLSGRTGGPNPIPDPTSLLAPFFAVSGR